MTQEEKSQAQDVLNGLLRDSYQQGYNQGFKDGTHVGGSGRTRGSIPPPPAAPTDGTVPMREGNPAEIKACVECRHCHTIGGYGVGIPERRFCRLASKIEPDPVTGRKCYTEKVHCWKERKDGSCGPEGKNFERIESRFRKSKKGLLDRLFPGMLPW